MTDMALTAEQAVANGLVTPSTDHHYDVRSGQNTYNVRIEQGDTFRDPRCNCTAALYDKPCWHAFAALMEDTRLSARKRAWADASAALKTLFAIVEDEDTPGLAAGGHDIGADEGVRTALLEALDAFDTAHDIDNTEET